jgi:hypothetical protein
MMPESSPKGPAAPLHPPLRIALCHLDSLVCLPGLNTLFAEMGEQIGLVLLSRRFGPKHGGVFTQLRRGLRRSGWRMTLWLGFDIVSAQIASAIAAMTAPLLGRERPLQSIRSLASRYGARVIEVADINDAETIATVSEFAPDLVLVFNFDQILQPAFIDVAASGVINVHPSILPSFRGPCPVFWALAGGCGEAGVSVHATSTPGRSFDRNDGRWIAGSRSPKSPRRCSSRAPGFCRGWSGRSRRAASGPCRSRALPATTTAFRPPAMSREPRAREFGCAAPASCCACSPPPAVLAARVPHDSQQHVRSSGYKVEQVDRK